MLILYSNHKQFVIVISVVEEDKVQQGRRELDERATAQRAAILGVEYLDTRAIDKTLPLAEGVIDISTMHKNRLVPLMAGNESQTWQFGMTTQTPQSFIDDLTRQYNDTGHNIKFLLISNEGFKTLMDRYDPAIKVVHNDIKIAQEGDSGTLKEVSDSLNSVGSDEIFDFLVDQADRLAASDIHIENQRTSMRIRMRVDGVLHPVADITKDRYRVILSTLASRANISTASSEAQSGHMQK
jgi:type II secretory ATPase GspE/PulE/Tfp pilus assembly ATPase PilB-like protein